MLQCDGISRRNISPRHLGGAILRAKNPGSLFLLHRTGKGIVRAIHIDADGADGKAIWDTATSLRAFAAVLPGMDNIALIGERPPMSNKVSGTCSGFCQHRHRRNKCSFLVAVKCSCLMEIDWKCCRTLAIIRMGLAENLEQIEQRIRAA